MIAKLELWLATTMGKAIAYGLAVLILVVAAWWMWDSFVESIRAPVVAELNKIATANASLVDSNATLVKANAALSQAMADRTKREEKIDKRLAGMEGALKAKKAADPEVKSWAETRIPDKVLQ